jgi:hypothetical protein
LARPVKCRACEQLETDREKVVKEKEGYFHIGECHRQYLVHKEFKRVELEKWNKLYKYILDLHGLKVLEKANVIRLQALRNGEDIVNGQRVKKYKTGADYSLMLDAYKLAEDSIRWCIQNKLNGSNDSRAINYCISVMIGKLNEAWVRQQNRQRQIEALKQELVTDNYLPAHLEETIKYNKRNATGDISEFL